MRFLVNQINEIPQLPGVYKYYSNANTLLYIGKAVNLKNRIKSYFAKENLSLKTQKLVSLIDYIEIIPVESDFTALLLEAKLIRSAQPKYNVIWKDDKHYIYIKITKEEFPKVLFSRKENTEENLFGPFPSSRIAREILSQIRNIFPFCTQTRITQRSCFFHHLDLCNPCPSEIAKQNGEIKRANYLLYRANIRNIKRILQGKISSVKKILGDKMRDFSDKKDFESAALYRDKIEKLNYLLYQYRPVTPYLENSAFLSSIRKKETSELTKLLASYYPNLKKTDRIECYDISNISGKSATGSMVTFVSGNPEKNMYRRFRIKSVSSPNDFAMLSEIIRRRLNHTNWPYPDIYLIDGGKPQLKAVKKVFTDFGIKTPVIGLAKEFEDIIVSKSGYYDRIRLPKSSLALNLIMRIRDEAHRFAHNYHTLIRLKNLFAYQL